MYSQQPSALSASSTPPSSRETLGRQVIGVDLMVSLESSTFLITVNYENGFGQTNHLQGLGTTPVIPSWCLKRHFARYGTPAKCVTYNGSQFASSELEQFAKEWGIDHTMSSPWFPQSNRKAGSAVKIAKSLIRKAWAVKEDPWLAILGFQNTLTQGSNKVPVQRVLGRRTRTREQGHCECQEYTFRVSDKTCRGARGPYKVFRYLCAYTEALSRGTRSLRSAVSTWPEGNGFKQKLSIKWLPGLTASWQRQS